MEQHKIQTSLGEIIVKIDPIFEIIVPEDERLVVTFKGANLSFRVGGLPAASRMKFSPEKDLALDKFENGGIMVDSP